jgi:ActR/RegA family two-component response regulator
LVDDEEQFVEVLVERLETRGFVVETSFSGDDALENAAAVRRERSCPRRFCLW